MQDKIHIFSKEEFMVLAAAAGISKIYGFPLREDLGEQEAVLAMQRLTEKGFLLSVDGKFQLQEMIADAMAQIKAVKTTIDVHKRSGRSCIVYIGDYGVKVSASTGREGMLEVQSIPLNEIWTCLTEEGWIPEEKEMLQ